MCIDKSLVLAMLAWYTKLEEFPVVGVNYWKIRHKKCTAGNVTGREIVASCNLLASIRGYKILEEYEFDTNIVRIN